MSVADSVKTQVVTVGDKEYLRVTLRTRFLTFLLL